PLEPLAARLVLEPARPVGPAHARLLADTLRSDDDVLEVEVDIREGGEELRVEARRALVPLPAGAGDHQLVHTDLGQRRDEPPDVTVALRDRMRLPELADLRVLVDVDRPPQQLEDAIGGHRLRSYHPRRPDASLRDDEVLTRDDRRGRKRIRL